MKKLIVRSVLTVLFSFPLTSMAGDGTMSDGMDNNKMNHKMNKEYTRDIPNQQRNMSASAKMTSPETVKKVQTELNDNGYRLNVDGVFGQSTSKALKAFQSKSGIATTGRIDKETLRALDVDLGEYDRSPASIDEERPAGTNNMSETQDDPATDSSM